MKLKNKIILVFLFVNQFAYCSPLITFDIKNSYSLNSIEIKNGKEKFFPSYFGGISVIYQNEIYHFWSSGVELIKLNSTVKDNTYSTEWIFMKKDIFYYHYQMNYQITSDKVKIRALDLGRFQGVDTLPNGYAEINTFNIDRCEHSENPVIIGVPYLTTFNLLFSNNCFVSIYFDFDESHASRIIPFNSIYSNTSVFYSQYAQYNPLTNGERNKLNETIFLKVSDNIEDVLPDMKNPVSKYIVESSKRVVFDDWQSFNNGIPNIKRLNDIGVKNIWHIVHIWQYKGYDVALPDVFPANPNYGGNEALLQLSNFNKSLGNLFCLHENYIDIFTESEKFNKKYLGLGSDNKYIFNWLQPYTLDTSYISKPTELFNLMGPVTQSIHESFNTTAAYHDVSASYDPSKYVDYDYTTRNAGMLIEPFNTYKALADTLRKIHGGPVSSEGLAHYLYVGYYDDICAQIHTAQSLPGSYGTEKLGGFYKPLFVDFNVRILREKAAVHGVGYYSRFFYNQNVISGWGTSGYSRDSALMYAATELAYGNYSFISSGFYDMMEQTKLEIDYVYPVQLKYSNSKVSAILYNDNGKLISASDYIRRYPGTFDNFFNKDFMSQVYIKYANGLVIFVNRNPFKKWIIKGKFNNGFASFHAIVDKKDSLYAGNFTGQQIELPHSNGWFCFDPD